jgi:hypothetical protein
MISAGSLAASRLSIDGSRRVRCTIRRRGSRPCVTAAGLIGGRALIVHAVDAEAAEFWKRRGFIPSKDDPLMLFRSIADIAASLSRAPQEF